mmetsp:Transcript_27087/g.65101  ORF Transcript_27087/g.65101 Transcript_27087/m.65101 type:complete len:80 (+) Transcript_27087:169-408(+)
MLCQLLGLRRDLEVIFLRREPVKRAERKDTKMITCTCACASTTTHRFRMIQDGHCPQQLYEDFGLWIFCQEDSYRVLHS